jgi:hypothetical protein
MSAAWPAAHVDAEASTCSANKGCMLRLWAWPAQEQLGDVASAVGAELEAIQGGLQRRADIAAARAMLELMQDTAHVMSKVSAAAVARGSVVKPTPGLGVLLHCFTHSEGASNT